MYCDVKLVLRMDNYIVCDTVTSMNGRNHVKLSSSYAGKECLLLPLFMDKKDIAPVDDDLYVFDVYESRVRVVPESGVVSHTFPEQLPILVVLLDDIKEHYLTVKTNIASIKKINSNIIPINKKWNKKEIIAIPYHQINVDDDLFTFDTLELLSKVPVTNTKNYSTKITFADKYNGSMCFLSYLPDPLNNQDNVDFLIKHF